MHGKDGEVIYVGKAKKLKNRVSQYFQAGRGQNIKTHTMGRWRAARTASRAERVSCRIP